LLPSGTKYEMDDVTHETVWHAHVTFLIKEVKSRRLGLADLVIWMGETRNANRSWQWDHLESSN
jgi:hypothetical protein